MAFYPDERIAMFIDGSNLYSSGKTLDFDIDYKKLLDLFKNKGRLIQAKYYTALLDHEDYSPIRPLIDWLDYNGFHVITKPAKSYTDRDGRNRVKGNMDIEMTIDMLQIAPHVDHILLFTGDGDFKAVVEAVQAKGVRVSVISTLKSRPAMLADELRRQANDFIELADMGKIIGRPKRDYSSSENEDEYEDL
ncbi:NYN domain-containing protein [Litorimonas sp.]|uniref:LabA-like NYN domain-containing protein n=1 Tax=Litorimonas sp. TaxID=1892381 RepID=UPI003A84A9DA